jgi:dihydrofolate synthase / folylpolyglutamate synthase
MTALNSHFDRDTAISTAEAADALAKIDALLDRFAHFGVELGLERIQRLLAALNHPQQRVPIIHVAGSNGKGSVCAYLSSVLTEATFRVGRYTSPHLVSWCERICINEQPIPADELYQLLQQVQAAIQPDQPSPTQFEVITAAAWLYFAQQQVDLAVIEVGLGGRLDATNMCDRPLVSIITSLSREHWQRLGPTLTDITREKAGILKSNCPAVIAPQPPEAERVLQQRLQALNCPAIWVKPATDLKNGWTLYGKQEMQNASADVRAELPLKTHKMETADTQFLHSLKYALPLPGAHQLINSALAIAALQLLQHQGWQISDEAIVQGIGKTRWQGRLQWFTWHDQPILIDGAHNPAAAKVLRQFIDSSEAVHQPVTWVMGMLTTKDHADVFRELLRSGDRLYLVPVPDHLSADPLELATLAREICPDLQEICTAPDVIFGLEEAIAASSKLAIPSTIVLCGSLYLIGHFFKQLATQG